MGIGTEDVPVWRAMYEYAALADPRHTRWWCGNLTPSGEVDIAFNPSGGYHHAFPEKAAGLSDINDNAIACSILADAGKRVLYLDVDVHNGDGVAYAFRDRSDVMTISLPHETRILRCSFRGPLM